MSSSSIRQDGKAQELYEIAKAKADEGDFAYELAALSLESHLAELKSIEKLTSKLTRNKIKRTEA